MRNRRNGVEITDLEREWFLRQLLLATDTAVVLEFAEQVQCLVNEFGRVCGRKK